MGKYIMLFEDAFASAGSDKKFNTVIENVIVDNEDMIDSDVKVNWYVHIDAKPWGIKSIDFFVTEVTGTYMVNDNNVTINSSMYELISEINYDSSIMPTTVEINTKERKITVY